MKNKKNIIVISILVLCVFILVLISLSRKTSENYILLDGITSWKYEKGEYEEISSDFFEGELTEIYTPINGLVGTYKITKSADGFLAYTDSILGNRYLGFVGDDSFDFAQFEKKKLDEVNLKRLSEILKERNISTYTELSTNEQISYDIDRDGKLETIISVSNYFLQNKDEQYFNFVYVIDGNDISYLVDKVYERKDDPFVGKYEIEYLISFQKKIMILFCITQIGIIIIMNYIKK